MITLATQANNVESTSKQGKADVKIIGARTESDPASEQAASKASSEQSRPTDVFNLLMPTVQTQPGDSSVGQGESQPEMPVESSLLATEHVEPTMSPLAMQTHTFHQRQLQLTGTQPAVGNVTQQSTLMSLSSATNEQTSLTSAKPVQMDASTLLQQTQIQPQQASPVFQLSTNQPNATPVQSAVTAAPVHGQSAEWASMRIDTQAGKWGEQMMQVLHDRVTLQAQQNLQEAKIRLDPPELGKLDLMVRVEGDRLSVQINASATATREALMQVSERLRVELQQQNFVHVDVNVGSDQGQQSHAEQTTDDEMTIFASRDVAPSETPSTTQYSEHWLNTQA